ncbi:MAG: hypothetical protein WBH03_01175, partial [Cyclobacteriaceae bacterium]
MKKALLFFSLILWLPLVVHGQEPVRRWYVVLHDFSAPFEYRSAEANRKLYRTLNRLFENEVTISQGANTLLLEDEQVRDVPFFDPARDNISLFYFGMRMQDLRQIRKPSGAPAVEHYRAFADQFLHQVTPDWISYREDHPDATYEDLFNEFRAARPAWNDGYSLSSYAYPAVITQLQDHYYDELVIITLSDYLAGSTFGNKQDAEILRRGVSRGSSTRARKTTEAQDKLSSLYYRIDYFDYVVSTGKYDNAGNRIFHGIKASKVKPHAGVTAANNAVMKINSDLSLEQLGYRDPDFKLSPVTINFEHNQRLTVEKIGVQVESRGEVVHCHWLARPGDEGELTDEDDDPIEADEATGDYALPATRLELGGITDAGELEDAAPVLSYLFYARYQTAAGDMPLLYQVNRPLTEENVDFDKNYSILMTKVLPVLILIGLALWFLYKRRPRRIRYRMST